MPITPVKLQQVGQPGVGRFHRVAVRGRGIASGLELLADALDPTTGRGAQQREQAATATIRADFDDALANLRKEGKDIRSIAVEERGFMRNDIRYAGFSSLAPGLFAEWAGEIGADDVNIAIREILQGNKEIANSSSNTADLYEKMVGEYADGIDDDRTRSAFSIRMNKYRSLIIGDSLTRQGVFAIEGALANASEIMQATFDLTAELDRPMNHKAALARADQKVHEATMVFPINEKAIDKLMLDEYLAFYLQPQNLHLADGALTTLRDEKALQDVGLRKQLNAQIATLPALQFAQEKTELDQLVATRKLEDEQYRGSFENGVVTQEHYDLARGDITKRAILDQMLEANAGFMYSTAQNSQVLLEAVQATTEEDFEKLLNRSIAKVDTSTRSAILLLHRNWRDGVSNPVASSAIKALTAPMNPTFGTGGGAWRITDENAGDNGGVAADVHHQMIASFYEYLGNNRDALREFPQKLIREAILSVEENYLNRPAAGGRPSTSDPTKIETIEEQVFRIEAEQAAVEAKKVEERVKSLHIPAGPGPDLISAIRRSLAAPKEALVSDEQLATLAEIRILRRAIGRKRPLAASPASAAEVNEPVMLATYGRSRADIIDSIIVGER